MKIEQIVKKLKSASEAYYNEGNSSLTDQEYDNLVEELKKLDPENPFLKTVGTPVQASVWKKVKHSIPMGSQLKVNTFEELESWAKSNTLQKQYCISEKLDGSSIELVFKKGKFVQGITRGDGEIGEDITENVSLMQFPKKLQPYPINGKPFEDISCKIRGEIILTKDTWQEHFPDERNPRNSAAGTARRKHDNSKCCHLVIFAFDIMLEEGSFETEYEKFNYLRKLGFNTPFYMLVDSLAKVQEYHEKYVEAREKINYEIDGLIVSENDTKALKEAGVVDNRPKGQRAYKFPAGEKTTTLLDVVWQTGRTGQITPIAIIDPTEIGGVTIQKVMLNNVVQIENQKLEVGCKVAVSRRNDVIPYLERRIEGGTKPIKKPETCPSCGQETTFDGVKLWCTNIDCPAQKLHRVLNYLKTAKVLGFGDKLAEKLMETGKLNTPADLFRLEVEDIASLEGLGEKVANKILSQIKANTSFDLPTFIKAVGIKGFSSSFAKLVVEKYPTLDDISKLEVNDLVAIKGIGPELAKNLVVGLKKSGDLINDLLQYVELQQGKEPEAEKGETQDHELSGKKICFTGCRPKGDTKTKMAEFGILEASGVSSNTDMLVVKDINSTSSKAKKAKSLGIPVVSLSEFEARLKFNLLA